MKAMVLAAGRGSRLRPLTDVTHKALLPIGDTCLLECNIHKLRSAGIDNIVINVHYLAEQVMDYLGDGARFGVTIHYSIEKECLGTGGGIYQALPLLGDEAFWLLSADIWTNFPIKTMSLPEEAHAHLIMVPNPNFHPQGDFGLSVEGRLNFSRPKYTYANLAVLHPRLFQNYKPGVFELGPVFRQAIDEAVIYGELYSGAWFNVGTESELSQLKQHLSCS